MLSHSDLYRSLDSPETITMGMCDVKLREERVWQTSKPEYFGIIRSSKIASGLYCSANANASSGEPLSMML